MTDVPEAERPHIISTPQFWIVFFLYVFNAVADFAAYAFAPLSVVSPIRVVVIIFNAFLANRIFGEKLGWSDPVGSVLILLGGSLSVVFGSRQVWFTCSVCAHACFRCKSLDKHFLLSPRAHWLWNQIVCTRIPSMASLSSFSSLVSCTHLFCQW